MIKHIIIHDCTFTMEKECVDCGVTYTNLDKETVSCRVCGAVLQMSRQQRERASRNQHQESLEDIMASLASSMESRASVPLSQSFLKTIGKVTLDDRFVLLYESTLRIILSDAAQLRFNVVPATFSHIPTDETITGSLVWGDPIYGEDSPTQQQNNDTTNNNNWSGNIVVFLRGKVSFAKKYAKAVAAHAAAVVVAQSFDLWPFVMADTENELRVLLPMTGETLPAQQHGKHLIYCCFVSCIVPIVPRIELVYELFTICVGYYFVVLFCTIFLL